MKLEIKRAKSTFNYSYLIYVLPPPGIKIQKYLSNENHKIFILKEFVAAFCVVLSSPFFPQINKSTK